MLTQHPSAQKHTFHEEFGPSLHHPIADPKSHKSPLHRMSESYQQQQREEDNERNVNYNGPGKLTYHSTTAASSALIALSYIVSFLHGDTDLTDLNFQFAMS